MRINPDSKHWFWTFAENNYNHAWEISVERFENKRIIVDFHRSGLLTLKNMTNESHIELCALIETRSRHVEELKYLGQPVDGTSALITSCLDPVTHKQWERTHKHGELADPNKTLDFLKDQCRILERCGADDQPVLKHSPENTETSSKAASYKIHATSTVRKPDYCQLCGKDHLNYQCREFRNM